MKLSLLFTFISLSFWGSAQQDTTANNQSVYAPFSWKTEKHLGITTGIVSGVALYTQLSNDRRTIGLDEILLLDRNNLNSIDRPNTYRWSLKAQELSDYLQYGALALPVLLCVDADYRQEIGNISIYGLESLLLTVGVTHIIKNTYRRARPFTYNEDVPEERKLRNRNNQSFPSGHTAFVANLSFLAAKTYIDIHPSLSKTKKIAIWSGAVIISSLTGTFRVTGGKHFTTDVILGGLIGAASGIIIPELHKKSAGSPHSFGVSIGGVSYRYALD